MVFCKKQPAFIGGCPFCTIKGIRCYNWTSTYYVTFISLLPGDHYDRLYFRKPLTERSLPPDKQKWNRLHKVKAKLIGASMKQLPIKMTQEKAIASAQRYLENPTGKTKAEESHFDISPWLSRFPGINMYDRLVNDPAHMLANNIGHVFQLILNTHQMRFTQDMLQEEHKLGRLLHIKCIDGQLLPWECTKTTMKNIDAMSRFRKGITICE